MICPPSRAAWVGTVGVKYDALFSVGLWRHDVSGLFPATFPIQTIPPYALMVSLAILLLIVRRVWLFSYVYRAQQVRGERSSRFFRPLTRCASIPTGTAAGKQEKNRVKFKSPSQALCPIWVHLANDQQTIKYTPK